MFQIEDSSLRKAVRDTCGPVRIDIAVAGNNSLHKGGKLVLFLSQVMLGLLVARFQASLRLVPVSRAY
jgi:hypothetical protein